MRKNAWSFFPAVLHPENADAAGVELIGNLQSAARSKTVFKTYDDGMPILHNTDEKGGLLGRKALVAVIRDYFRIHYGE